MAHDHSQIPVQEISDLLEAVSKKVPDLISSLLRTVYSQEAGTEMGKAVGGLYKELIAADIPQDVALKMATDYMISLKDVLRQATNMQGAGQHMHSGGHGGARPGAQAGTRGQWGWGASDSHDGE